MTINGWSSISDSLVNNKCWICQQSFQKGKIKKVFQLSQLVSCFITMLDNSNNDNLPILSSNISDCYNSYLSMPSTDSIEKATMLEKELLKKDIALWMSGLVCCSTEECMKQFIIIVPSTNDDNNQQSNNNQSNNNTNNKERKSKINNLFTFANANDECGPNCKCDSPWKFELPGHRTKSNDNNGINEKEETIDGITKS